MTETTSTETPATYNVRTGHGTVHRMTDGRTYRLHGGGCTNRLGQGAGKADCGTLTSAAATPTDQDVTCPKCLAR